MIDTQADQLLFPVDYVGLRIEEIIPRNKIWFVTAGNRLVVVYYKLLFSSVQREMQE
jgi:hypothetical protein